jgi:hypothetical protein
MRYDHDAKVKDQPSPIGSNGQRIGVKVPTACA